MLDKMIRLICFVGVMLLFAPMAQAATLSVADTAHFLEQSSWGSTNASLQNCQQLGSFNSCLRAQFNTQSGLYPAPAAAPENGRKLFNQISGISN